MAIQVQTLNATDLRLATAYPKRNYATALSVGGAAGQVVGHWHGVWVRLPATYAGSGRPALLGWDFGGAGAFNTTQDCVIRIPQDSFATTTIRRRLQITYGSGSQAFAGTEGNISGIDQIGYGVPTLIIAGVSNIGTNAAPVWRNWAAICPSGGTPTSMVAATATAAAYVTGTTGRLFHQIFVRQGSSTIVGTALEEAVLVTGDFPWDTLNNRPHHAALQALAGAGANPFVDYAGLVAAQNAGTLPYPNLRTEGGAQGRGTIEFRFSLANLAAGLINQGAQAGQNLSESGAVGGLADVASIVPAHWTGGAPTISEPAVKFIGGRGLRAYTISGTYLAGTTTLQRRWEVTATGLAVPGFDWATVGTFGSGVWSDAATLPVGGPYSLKIRDPGDAARTAESGGWLVGTVVLNHGQSSMDQVTFGEGDGSNNPLGLNRLGLSVDAGANGVLLRYQNPGSGPTWSTARPSIISGTMASGATPAVAHGAVAMLNEWNARNPGHPLLIASIAIGGTNQGEWADNIAAYSGSVGSGNASWLFMGTIGAVPDAASGNSSGVVEVMAQTLGRYVDSHAMMWAPGIADVATGTSSRALYVSGIDARFSASPAAPWLIFPVWRIARDVNDASGSPTRRMRHLDFIAELGARGLQGPCWLDPVMVGAIGHSAYTNGDNVVAGQPGDQNHVGQARLGRGIGRALAWVWDRRIKVHGGRLLNACFGDGTRTTIEIELGRQLRTLNGAAVSNQFWISIDNGVNWSQAGFSVALARNNTAAILTTTGAAFPASNVRVEYAWNFPFSDGTNPPELSAETNLYGLLYDNQTHRGSINLAAAARAGTPLQGINRSGAGVAGLPVLAKGAARLVTSERFTGTRTITARLMAADGVTVLRERTLAISAS